MEQENETKQYTICKFCEREMRPGCGCRGYMMWKGGKAYESIKAGDFKDRWPEMHDDELCHDCGCAKGQYHHDGCSMEACPICGDQRLFCGCKAPITMLHDMI